MFKNIEVFYAVVLVLLIGYISVNMNRVVPVFSDTYGYKPVIDKQPGQEHIKLRYNQFEKKITIPKSPDFPIAINDIAHEDEYRNKKYILTLPDDYKGVFEYDEYIISDSLINSINIVNEESAVKIIIDEKEVLCYLISEDEHNIYINAVKPSEVYDKVIIIDPGHGGADPGCDYYGLFEKDLTLDIAKRLEALLEQNGGIKFYYTRLDDSYVDLTDRARLANSAGGFFLSIHINANEYYKSIHGSEAFYVAKEGDDGISMRFAEALSESVAKHLNSKNRGFKEESYVILNEAHVPAALCELGFISNYEEALRFWDEAYRQRAADGLYEAIVYIFE